MKPMQFLTKAARLIEKLSEYSGRVAGLFVLLMIPLVTFEVIMRYVFNRAPMLADEFSAYFLVATVFIGLAYTMKEKRHIRVEMLTSRLKPRAAKWLRLVTLLVALGVVGILVKETIAFVQFSIRLGLKSESWLMIPSYIPQMVMPVGAVFFFLQIVVEISKTILELRSSYTRSMPSTKTMGQ
jgi:TRAP-type C4-dicarboxylate transport system permease small subunit